MFQKSCDFFRLNFASRQARQLIGRKIGMRLEDVEDHTSVTYEQLKDQSNVLTVQAITDGQQTFNMLNS